MQKKYFLILSFLSSIFLNNAYAQYTAIDRVWELNKCKVRVLNVDHQGWQDVVEEKIFYNKEECEREYQKFKSKMKLNPASDRLLKSRSFLWTAQNKWTWDWEKKYSDWVAENFDQDFFVKYNIGTDCADVAYALRWIFSRIYKLPMASRLTGTRNLFTNESMRPGWENLPTHENWWQDQRFLTALKYVLDFTYTETLFQESYPIAIHKDALLNGTHLLMYISHTLLVYKRTDSQLDIPFYLLSSTVPQSIRTLYEETPIGIELFDTEERDGGILKFKWWEKKNDGLWYQTRAENMPYYSLEQYSDEMNDGDFGLNVIKKLNPSFSPYAWFKAATDDLKNLLESRRNVVLWGYEFCSQNDCSPGTENYENWSTPSRDKRLLSKINMFDTVYQYWNEELKEQYDVFMGSAAIEIDGDKISWSALWELLYLDLIPYDPRLSVNTRWAAGAEGYLSAYKLKLESLIQERINLVEKNEDSINLDSVISAYFTYLEARAKGKDLEVQKKIYELKKDLLIKSHDGYKKFETLREKKHFWLSQKDLSYSQRWREDFSVSYKIYENYKVFQAHENGYVILKGEGTAFPLVEKSILIHKTNNKVIEVPLEQGFNWINIDKNYVFAVDQEKNMLGIYDIYTKKFSKIEIDESIKDTVFHFIELNSNKEILFVSSAFGFTKIANENGVLKIKSRERKNNLRIHLYLNSINNIDAVISYFEGDKIYYLPKKDILIKNPPISSYVDFLNSRFLYFSDYSVQVIFDTHKKAFLPIAFNRILGISMNGLKVVERANYLYSTIKTFNESYEVLSEKNVLGFYSDAIKNSWFFYDNKKFNVLKFHEDEKEEVLVNKELNFPLVTYFYTRKMVENRYISVTMDSNDYVIDLEKEEVHSVYANNLSSCKDYLSFSSKVYKKIDLKEVVLNFNNAFCLNLKDNNIISGVSAIFL